MTSPQQKPNKASPRRVVSGALTIRVKCSHCGNTFYAPLAEAVCPKCERPANRPLPPLWRALSFFLPPLGLGRALWVRLHSPVAALQGLRWSLCGAGIYGALALIRSLF